MAARPHRPPPVFQIVFADEQPDDENLDPPPRGAGAFVAPKPPPSVQAYQGQRPPEGRGGGAGGAGAGPSGQGAPAAGDGSFRGFEMRGNSTGLGARRQLASTNALAGEDDGDDGGGGGDVAMEDAR